MKKTVKIPATLVDGDKTFEPMTPVTLDADEADRLVARWAERGAEIVETSKKSAAEKPAADPNG